MIEYLLSLIPFAYPLNIGILVIAAVIILSTALVVLEDLGRVADALVILGLGILFVALR